VAAEAYERLVEQAIAEFEGCVAGAPNRFIGSTGVIDGAAEFCGSRTDPTCWNVAYVRDDGAVLPLAVGHRNAVVLEYNRLDKTGEPIWDPAQFPPPVVIVGEKAYHFAATRGRVLLGAVKLERRAVLLAALDDRIAVIHVAGRARTVLHVGRLHSFRELDVDCLLRLQRRSARGVGRAAAPGPVRPSPTILAHHQRIVHGPRVDVGAGPTIPQALFACFEDLADRARVIKEFEGRRLRGQRKVRDFTWVLYRLALKGVGNLFGCVSDIITQIQEHFPDFVMSPGRMSKNLALLRATGTCLLSPRGERERSTEINLLGLDDPRSAIHRRFCRETRGRHYRAATVTGVEDAPSRAAAPPPVRPAPVVEPRDEGAAATTVSAADDEVTATLDALSELPPEAGPLLLLAAKMARARIGQAAPSQGPGLEPTPAEAPASAATATSPAPSPTSSPGAELSSAEGEEPPAAMAMPPASMAAAPRDAGDDEVEATLAALRSLPPEAGPILLTAANIARSKDPSAAGIGSTRASTSIQMNQHAAPSTDAPTAEEAATPVSTATTPEAPASTPVALPPVSAPMTTPPTSTPTTTPPTSAPTTTPPTSAPTAAPPVSAPTTTPPTSAPTTTPPTSTPTTTPPTSAPTTTPLPSTPAIAAPPDGGDEKATATIAALRGLPAEAGPILLTAVTMARTRMDAGPPTDAPTAMEASTPASKPAPAATAAATPSSAATAASTAAATVSTPSPAPDAAAAKPRRRLHLSPDHTLQLPRAASLVMEYIGRAPRGDEPRGARGPPVSGGR